MMTLLFGIGISGTLGIFTMLPLFLVSECDLERHFANTLIAMSRVATLFMALAAGWLTDKIGAGKTLVGVFLISGVTTVLLGVIPCKWIIPIVFIQPLVAVCFFPAGFAALSMLSPPNSRNIAVSLTVPIAFLIGGGAVPAFIGLMGDTASFSLGITVMGAITLIAAMLAKILMNSVDQKKAEIIR